MRKGRRTEGEIRRRRKSEEEKMKEKNLEGEKK